MNAPDPDAPESTSVQDRPHSRRRFWRWGIWFWVVAWIVSMLVEVGLQVYLKDRPCMTLGAEYGSLVIALDDQDVHEGNHIGIHGPFFTWSKRNHRLHSEHPEFLFARLGSVMWRTSGDRHTVALPVCGILWLWLIGGWVARVKKNQRLDFRSKCIMIATLILLPLVMFQASRTMDKVLAENEVSRCMMNMRNIQCAVRSYWGMKGLYSGKPIPWDEIFGPLKFVSTSTRTCPSGQNYILDACIPAKYQLVVQCPNPEHQQRLQQINTLGW